MGRHTRRATGDIMSILHSILTDLADESQQLDAWVDSLANEQWRLDTPAAGWTIAHQIGHLAWTDEASLTAIDDPEAFGQMMKARSEERRVGKEGQSRRTTEMD